MIVIFRVVLLFINIILALVIATLVIFNGSDYTKRIVEGHLASIQWQSWVPDPGVNTRIAKIGPNALIYTLRKALLAGSSKIRTIVQPEFGYLPPNYVEQMNGYDECPLDSNTIIIPGEISNQPVCKSTKQLLNAIMSSGRTGEFEIYIIYDLYANILLGYDHPLILDGCSIHWYTAKETCTVLKKYREIVFVGDLTLIHVYQALMVMVRNDINTGGLAKFKFSNKDEIKKCSCHKQISNGLWGTDCTSKFGVPSFSYMLDYVEESLNWERTMQCPEISVSFVESYKTSDVSESRIQLNVTMERDMFAKNPAAIIFSNSWHQNLHSEDVLHWFKQIEPSYGNFLQHGTIIPPAMLFLMPDASDTRLFQKYWAIQDPAAVWNFHNDFEKLLEKHTSQHSPPYQVDIMKMWNATIQNHSLDGIHANLETNLLKVQLLLNWLDLHYQEFVEPNLSEIEENGCISKVSCRKPEVDDFYDFLDTREFWDHAARWNLKYGDGTWLLPEVNFD